MPSAFKTLKRENFCSRLYLNRIILQIPSFQNRQHNSMMIIQKETAHYETGYRMWDQATGEVFQTLMKTDSGKSGSTDSGHKCRVWQKTVWSGQCFLLPVVCSARSVSSVLQYLCSRQHLFWFLQSHVLPEVQSVLTHYCWIIRFSDLIWKNGMSTGAYRLRPKNRLLWW